MTLVFQERTDGFRVVRMVGDMEHMIANVCCKNPKPTPITPENPLGVVKYEDKPRRDCTIHSAVGPLTVAEIEEILAKLPKK